MPSTLLAVDRAQTVTRTAWSLKPLYITPFGFSNRQNFQLHGSGFNGEMVDRATGHYPLGNGYRSYNPALARFNSQDRLSPFGRGGLNGYGYCEGDPVNWRDPGGQARLTYFPRVLRPMNPRRHAALKLIGANERFWRGIDYNMFGPSAPLGLAGAQRTVEAPLIHSVVHTRFIEYTVDRWQVYSYRPNVGSVVSRIARNLHWHLTRKDFEMPSRDDDEVLPDDTYPARNPKDRPAPYRFAAKQPRRRPLPRRVLMAASSHANGYEESAEPEGSLSTRQLRIRQG